MGAPMTTDIKQRKADHLDLCATDDVAFRGKTTLLEHVRLVHQSLPDLDLDAIDLSVELLGKTLRAPIVIAAMTGGHERAAEVNRTLASIANERGYGFGLGSQRAMQKRPDTAWTFDCASLAEAQCGLDCGGYWSSLEAPFIGTSGGTL